MPLFAIDIECCNFLKKKLEKKKSKMRNLNATVYGEFLKDEFDFMNKTVLIK